MPTIKRHNLSPQIEGIVVWINLFYAIEWKGTEFHFMHQSKGKRIHFL